MEFYSLRLEKWDWKELSASTENGYGIRSFADENGKITALYVGGFKDGLRNGRGFMLNLKETEHRYERKATYEDVMKTAEFDSCGRIIHVDNIQTVSWTETHRSWMLADDGLWADDAFVEPVERDFTPWKDQSLEIAWDLIENGEVVYHHLTEQESISARKEEGWLDLDDIFHVFLTPLPDGRLLMLHDDGCCFALKMGESQVWDHEDSRYTYRIL